MKNEHFISISYNGLVLNLDLFQEEKEGIPLNLKLDFSNPNHSWEVETVGVWVNVKEIRNFIDLLRVSDRSALRDIDGRELLEIAKDGENFILKFPSLLNSPSPTDDIFEMTVRIGKSFIKDMIDQLSSMYD